MPDHTHLDSAREAIAAAVRVVNEIADPSSVSSHTLVVAQTDAAISQACALVSIAESLNFIAHTIEGRPDRG